MINIQDGVIFTLQPKQHNNKNIVTNTRKPQRTWQLAEANMLANLLTEGQNWPGGFVL